MYYIKAKGDFAFCVDLHEKSIFMTQTFFKWLHCLHSGLCSLLHIKLTHTSAFIKSFDSQQDIRDLLLSVEGPNLQPPLKEP